MGIWVEGRLKDGAFRQLLFPSLAKEKRCVEMTASASPKNGRPRDRAAAKHSLLRCCMCFGAVLILAGLLAPVLAAAGPSRQ